jgi:multimeric flavodoxin WrbA
LSGGDLNPLVILGSARPDGETRRAIEIAFSGNADLIVLAHHHMGAYDYAHANDGDDFRSATEAMLAHDRIVFATPVYWYAMSAPLKIFFDRLTDLTETAKSGGRALKDKQVWVIATGTENVLPEGFEVPFRRTCEYFAMLYRGAAYLYTGEDRHLRTQSEGALAGFARQAGIVPGPGHN